MEIQLSYLPQRLGNFHTLKEHVSRTGKKKYQSFGGQETHILGLVVLQNRTDCSRRRAESCVEAVDVSLLHVRLLLDTEADLQVAALVVSAVAASGGQHDWSARGSRYLPVVSVPNDWGGVVVLDCYNGVEADLRAAN